MDYTNRQLNSKQLKEPNVSSGPKDSSSDDEDTSLLALKLNQLREKRKNSIGQFSSDKRAKLIKNKDNLEQNVSSDGQQQASQVATVTVKVECDDSWNDDGAIEPMDKNATVDKSRDTQGGCSKEQRAESPDATATNSLRRRKRMKKKRKLGKMVTCRECDAKFPTHAELKEHSMEHQGVSEYKCVVCGESLPSRIEFEIHEQSHSGKKPFSCHVCLRGFMMESYLKRHMRNHPEGRPFCCQFCPKRFTSSTKLNTHMVRHKGDMPYYCNACKLRYATREELDAHVTEFESLPTHCVCQQCGLFCETRSIRSHHYAVNHSGADILSECEYCGNSDECPHKPQKSKEDLSKASSENGIDEDGNTRNPLETENSVDEMTCPTLDWPKPELTFDQQYNIVSKLFKGRKVTELCQEYNLTQAVVNDLWDRREDILDFTESDSRLDKMKYKAMDSMLLDWFNKKREENEQVTGKMMMEKAGELAIQCGHHTFNNSMKWIDRFKKRHSILLRPTPHKREPVQGPFGVKCKEMFLQQTWPELRGGFTDEDIFTGDEIGLFYNSSNGRILRKMGKRYIHGQPRDRLSIFICTNLTGSEKKKLLVCGTEDPLRGSHRSPHSLPVRYVRQEYGQFTTAMFEAEIKAWDAQLERDGRRALLILDRASIHTKMPTLNLKLVFVPWKASTVLMPIKNGISEAFRMEFRKLMLVNKGNQVARGVSRRLTCLEGLEMLDKVWSRIMPSTIMQSFASAGFEAINVYRKAGKTLVSPPFSVDDQIEMCKWLSDYDVDPFYGDIAKLDCYLSVEEELLTDQGTHSSVFGGNRGVTEREYVERPAEEVSLPIGTEKSLGDGDKEHSMSKIRAMKDLEIVRRYLEGSNTSYEMFDAFAEIEKFLLHNSVRLVTVDVKKILSEGNGEQ